MGKFSAAKMSGAQDVKMQNAFNQLIDLLDTGYVSETMLGGHKVRISVDPRGGLQILSDDVQIGGIILINGVPVNVAEAITNDATDPECWATIGAVEVDGYTYNGLSIYRKSISSSIPSAIITIGPSGVITLIDGNNDLRINFPADGSFNVLDSNAVVRIAQDATSSRMRSPDGLNLVYITNSGVFKSINGVVTAI